MAGRITVNAPDGQYDIVIESGILQQGERLVSEFGLNVRTAVCTTDKLVLAYGEAMVKRLPDAALITMADGEAHKNIETVQQIYSNFVAVALDRSSTVMALGGGVTGDTFGFAAATYMRGVRLVQVPTSLLAMVDSSVGGKVGVDLPEGKNLVGAFKQPDAVIIDPEVLSTLPDEEWRNGMAEVIKHGFIADAALLDADLHRLERAEELVERAVQVKVNVVQQDPYEHGIRAWLNLGHTFAHAIEQITNYRWAHGAAVGFGLVAAARLSYALKLCDSGLPEEVEAVVVRVGLPNRLDGLDSEAIYRAMATDKKWKHGRSRFILLRGIAQPEIVEDVSKDVVIDVLQQLQ